jgi:two-component system, LytTR family, sensor kinase
MDLLMKATRRRWPLALLAYLGIWTIPGLISTSQLMLSYSLRGDDPPLSLVLRLSLPGWYVWAALAPLVFVAARRFPIEAGSLRRSIPLHLAFNIALTAVWVAVVITLRTVFELPGQQAAMAVMVSAMSSSLLTYWTLVLGVHAFRYHQDRETRARREAELSGQLSEARLSALKAQLQPHFLFNTLNAISAFVRSDPDRAETMLADLGALLRKVLESTDAQIVPLSHEIEFVDGYLAIQQTRMGDRLTIDKRVEPKLFQAGVPSMLLQPLVENAVEHGIADRRSGGVLTLTIRGVGGRMRLEISNDGPGVSDADLDPAGWRVGLKNTRDRLRQLFGDDQEFSLQAGPHGGVTAVVVIPLVACESGDSAGNSE